MYSTVNQIWLDLCADELACDCRWFSISSWHLQILERFRRGTAAPLVYIANSLSMTILGAIKYVACR